jgi:hypothetical protein
MAGGWVEDIARIDREGENCGIVEIDKRWGEWGAAKARSWRIHHQGMNRRKVWGLLTSLAAYIG